MRTKNFVIFLVCIICTSVYLCLFGSQRPSIQTIVTETHKQLNNLKNFKENLIVVEEKTLVADEKFLTLIGFSETPRLYPDDVWKNTSLPIIVTVVASDQELRAVGFVKNAQHFAPNHTVIVYNLGLSQFGLELIQRHCNHSHCLVINFDFSLFPSHIEEENFHAYRPLIIADAANRAGAVLFLENDQRLVSGKLESLLATAENGGGVVSWATRHATSSLTHPKMFDYFHSTPDNFLFVPMVRSSRLLIMNTKIVHTRLLLPWVQCALTQDCIAPVGAQSSGCRFDKKPQYRYSGCHRYDGSALNIALALAFNFDDSKYSYSGKEIYFRTAKNPEEGGTEAGTETVEENNSTDPFEP